MSLESELAELNTVYWAQHEHLEQLEAQLVLYKGQSEYCTMLEQLVRDFSDFVDGLSLSAIPRTKRDALLQRTGELLEGKERAG